MSAYVEMVCAKCGAVMNRHAEKLDYSEEPADTSEIESTLGGGLLEIHMCPRCGWTDSRRASTAAV